LEIVQLNFKEIATATMVLFAVIDIIGSVPIIIDLRQKNGQLRSGLASFVALVIMILFLFLGQNILSLIGITVGDFAIAGSLVIFFLALEMILGVQLYKEDDSPSTASVVPLAFPLIAGAGTYNASFSEG
jgi:multiple antibiotic resistance protein